MLAYQFQPSADMSLVELPDLAAAPGELLLDVVSVGICGTDLKIARGEHRMFPRGTERIPGHELVGQVLPGSDLPVGLSTGDLVAVAPNMACGACPPCVRGRANLCDNYAAIGLTVDGGFAEQVRIPAMAVAQGNVLPLDAGVDVDLAVLMEPVAAVLRGVNAVGLGKGDTLVITGAGPIGLIALLLAKARGVAHVIVSEPSDDRRRIALELGADAALDPTQCDVVQEVRRGTGGAGADVVMVTTPVAQVFAQSLDVAAVGGRVNFFAGLPASSGRIGLEANLVHYRELTVTGTTANTLQDCKLALQLVLESAETFKPLVTHRHPLSHAAEGFADAVAGDALKVVLTP
ncbi:MAG: zinc-binding dehydrogenase [Actinomycetales bacterium]|nr:zinc-binding dehydrogenase [Actinomycetales bacterium]